MDDVNAVARLANSFSIERMAVVESQTLEEWNGRNTEEIR
jgi:hypothetical protein